MGSPIENPRLAAAEPRPRFDPYTGQPLAAEEEADKGSPSADFWQQQREATEAKHVQDTLPPPSAGPSPVTAVNPYAPTGWQAKHREEFDQTLPSGQLARIMRLEREDLFRLNLMGYLDTFTPLLMEDTISAEERNRRVREKMGNDASAVTNMFMAIDEVVMAATVRPRVTNDQNKVDYGGPQDWANPRFVATAYIHDLEMDDRFAIFAAAFGRSMDDLKSVWEQAPGMASVADQPGVQPSTQ